MSALIFIFLAGILLPIAKASRSPFPPVTFIVVAYVLGFPLTFIFPDSYLSLWGDVPFEDIEYGMLWAMKGFSAFILGYVLISPFRKQRSVGIDEDEYTVGRRIIYAQYLAKGIGCIAILAWLISVVFFGISLVFIESEMVGSDTAAGAMVQLLTLLSSLRYPFFVCFLLLYYAKKIDKSLIFILCVLLVFCVVEIVTTGSKATIIRCATVAIMSLAFLPIRLGFRHVASGLAALVLVYGSFLVITEYRSLMYGQLIAGRNVFDLSIQAESFGLAIEASLPFINSGVSRNTEIRKDDVLSRFGAGMYGFANLLKQTGRQSPYEYAWESLLVPIYSIAPRFLIPNKPEFFNSGRNAQEYYGWSFGGISVTLLGSLYYAWGYLGLIFGMLLIGIGVSYMLYRVGQSWYCSPHTLIVLISVLVSMVDIGQTFQSIITNCVRVGFVLWLLYLSYPYVRIRNQRRKSELYKMRIRRQRL